MAPPNDARRYILDAWQRAHAADPDLTLRAWAGHAFPDVCDPDLARRIGQKSARRSRDPKSAAAEFYRIKAGGGNPDALLERSRERGYLTMQVVDEKGNVIGYTNIVKPTGISSFDIETLKHRPDMTAIAQAQKERLQRQYQTVAVGRVHAGWLRTIGRIGGRTVYGSL